ncbi:serine/threonine-protein kinase Nek4 isoform X2 [Rhinoraja longicauda]
MERYAVVRTVGRGSYGEVQLLRRGGGDSKQYVVKKLNLRSVSSRERKAAEQEAQLLSQLRHPNIVTYRESWEGDDGLLYIVMGYCEGGDLYHKLKEQKGILLSESQVVEWFVQIAMALQSDVWALGCCAFEMATLKHAFNAKDMNSLVFKIIEGKLPPIPKEYSQQLEQLISSMLSRRPEERPDVKSILRKSYIKGHIASFLEATKAKAIKTRKKPAASILPSKCESRIALQDLDPTQKSVKKEEKESKKSKPNYVSYNNQPKDNSSSISHQALNSSSDSLASISKVHIDDVNGPERRNSNSCKMMMVEPAPHLQNGLNAESNELDDAAQGDNIGLHNGVMMEGKVEKSHNQILDELLDGKDDTFKLLQPIFKDEHSLEVQVNFESTEKLLQPFEAVKITEDFLEKVKKQTEDPMPFPPHCSSSEPSVSRQYREEENDFKRKTEKDRPLSARERRRLKQSREEFPYSVSTSRRNSHCVALESYSYEENQNVKVNRSSSDAAIHRGKKMSELSDQLSDDDDCSSSTSSTDKSEGDGKEVKPDSSEMHDLVKLMTQTLRMDPKDANKENPLPAPEFKLRRKYRDTLILHGKTKEDPEDFCFNDFPTEVGSAPAKIKRTIEALRIDVLKGLGVKLLEKVYNIMEDENEARREESLQEHMGEELYQNYSMKVQQLKFFEDNSNF